MAFGTVRFFKVDKGWGAISSDDLPTGLDAFVHFSAIQSEGYRSFDAGDEVDFDFEPAIQDSFRFIATRAQKVDPSAVNRPDRGSDESATGSPVSE